MNASDADLRLSGRVILDAGGDDNAFFVIRSSFKLTVADSTEVVLVNGAQPCAVFWQADQQVSIGKSVHLFGTVIAGSGGQSGSTLVGLALARTAAVTLDQSTITLPVYDTVASPLTCTHLQ